MDTKTKVELVSGTFSNIRSYAAVAGFIVDNMLEENGKIMEYGYLEYNIETIRERCGFIESLLEELKNGE